MKNKFLALAAFGAAALGSAIVSAPAQAQINPGPTEDITVNVTVPEILYLRTITDADVELLATDFTGVTLTSTGTTPPGYYGSDQTEAADGTVDLTSPFAAVGTAPITKTIPSAYVVWSNSPTTYTVTVAPGTFANLADNTKTLAVALGTTDPTATGGVFPAEGLMVSTPRDIVLDITPTGAESAGTYQGLVNVSVVTP